MLKVHPLFILLFALPIAAIALILAARRWKSVPKLSLALVISGITGAILTALIVFISSTVPIAPYETSQNSWNPLFELCLLSLYAGFGLGVTVGTLLISPFIWIRARNEKSRQDRADPASFDRQKGEDD